MATKPSIAKLKKKLDSVFSKWVRYSHSPDGVHVTCYTCGVTRPIKKMHNGHHISRAIPPTRYHVNNCRPQCVRCNTYLEGLQHVFAQNLRTEIGEDAYQMMIEESKQKWKWDRCQLEADIAHYQALNKAMGVR